MDANIIKKDMDAFIYRNKSYILLAVIALFSYFLFKVAYMFQQRFHEFMDVATYLAWHNLFEFTAILVSLAVFLVAYYTYGQTKNLRFMFLGSVFLAIGMVDTFHTLSFKGMPAFFIDNDDANRATTFWIIARLLGGLGFLISGLIPVDAKSHIKKWIFVVPAALFSFATFIFVSYFPRLLPAMYIEGKGLTVEKIILEYVIVILLAVTIILFMVEYRKTKDYLMILFSCALILSIFSEFAFISYNKVYDIYNYLGHVYKFIAYFIILRITFTNNVQKPYVELSKAQDALKDYAENLDKLVDQRTVQLREMNRQLKAVNLKLLNDIEYARDIQKAMLPTKLPSEKEVFFSARYFPAERVSGDFYNVFKLDQEHIGFYIGDVSGHGVPAAMLTIFINQSIKEKKDRYGNNYVIAPSEVLKHSYEAFNNTNFKNEVYIVLLYAVYNFKTRELTYASAGLNVMPLITDTSGRVTGLPIRGFPICKFAEFHTAEYEDKTIVLNQGDKVLFYTDGLIEAENTCREQFSEERLKYILKMNGAVTGIQMISGIEKGIFDFIDVSKLKDDITFFVMEVK